MVELFTAGKAVFVRLSGRLGHVLGLSQSPAYVTNDEPVYDVKHDDDGTVVQAGHSSLGEPEEAEQGAEQSAAPAEEAAAPAESAPAPGVEQASSETPAETPAESAPAEA